MKISKSLVKQIQKITETLIDSSFQIEFNWVSEKNGVIAWDNFKDISFSLKKIPYEQLYQECVNENAFNFKLLDGALIQFMYECNKSEILKHRLAFYPNPNVERFQDDPENFENNHFGNELFSEIYEKRAVVFPVRFDFDIDNNKYIEHDHSYSHLTLGNYSNCRIPVAKPISPNKFMLFILKSFYFDKFKESFEIKDFECYLGFDCLLTDEEKKYVHISF